MLKIRKLIYILLFLGFITSGYLVYSFQDQLFIKTKEQAKSNKVSATFLGNVEFPGVHVFDVKTTLMKALNSVGVKSNSNLKSWNLNDYVENDKIYLIVKQDNTKIKFKDINESILRKIGLRINQIKTLLKYKEETKEYKWSDILKLTGFGPKTLEKLKNNIEIT